MSFRILISTRLFIARLSSLLFGFRGRHPANDGARVLSDLHFVPLQHGGERRQDPVDYDFAAQALAVDHQFARLDQIQMLIDDRAAQGGNFMLTEERYYIGREQTPRGLIL